MWEGLSWVQTSVWRNSPSLPFVLQLPQLWKGGKSHPALVISSAQWMEAAVIDDTPTFELLSAALWAHKGHQRGQDHHLPLSHALHPKDGIVLPSFSCLGPLPIPASQLVAQALVGSEAGSPALWAVGDQQYLDMSQQRSHSTALHMKALLAYGSDRQHVPLGTASPTPRVTPDPRLNAGGLTPWEKNILGRLNTGKHICKPGRKSLDEICTAIFQTSWERVQNNSLHWSSGAWGTIIAAIISTKQGDNMAAALYSASTPPFLLPCWAWRQITHQRACPWIAEIMKILHNWLHCLYKQHAHSCLPLKKMLFVWFLAFFFFCPNACMWIRYQFTPKNKATAWSWAWRLWLGLFGEITGHS